MSATQAIIRRGPWPASDMHMTGIETGAGATAVVAAGYSGLEVVGTLGGILSGLAAIIALVLSVAAGNAKRRRQYDDDIRAAETRGRVAERAQLVDDLTEARRDRDEYRERYLDLLEARGLRPSDGGT